MIKRGMDWWREIWGVGLRPKSMASLVFALACVAVATFVRIGLGFVSPDSAVFAPYYSATLVAALVGGTAAGGVAAVAGGIAAIWLFVPADWGILPFVKEQLVSLLLFGISSAVIIWAAESYRGLLRRLREEEATRQLLNHELDHRIRNILASVQAIVNQTLRDHTDIHHELSGRIAALATTNDLLLKSEWCGASLREILSGEFAPYGLARFDLAGEDVECAAALAIPLALVVHELTTNASKYGALSGPDGRVAVAWTVTDDRLDLHWVERGGPPPNRPARSGFGTKLLRSSLRPFDGAIDMRFDTDGLRLALSVTLPRSPAAQASALESTTEPGAISMPPPSVSAVSEIAQAHPGPGALRPLNQDRRRAL